MRLLFLLAATVASAAAQPLTVFPEPSGEPSRLCTTHEATRVCRVEENGSAALVVSMGGGETARWSAASGVQAGDIAVFSSDLDRDGGHDLIVATQTAVSNGLGVAYWTVDVLPDGASQPGYSFQAEDFSPQGANFGHDGSRLIHWATDWIQSDDPSGRRPSGMYFTGRPFVLTVAGLVPAARLPIRARRLLNSFDRDPEVGPVGWLSDRRAESRRTDPALGACDQGHEVVTPQGVREATDEWGARSLILDVSDGRVLTYGPGVSSEESIVTHLGDAASGRLFPVEYQPARLAEALTGRELRLTTCAENGGVRTRVLWI